MSVPLTAHLCAVAIVAAANAYGDDPVRAVEVKRGVLRRALMAAATALVAQTGQKPSTVCRVLSIHLSSYSRSGREDDIGFRTAVRSASGYLSKAIPHPMDAAAGPEPEISATAVLAVQEPARVDHTPAIAEAMRRRKAAGKVAVTVVGVEHDKALLPPPGAGGCAWPMGDPRAAGYRRCEAPVVAGRMYCAAHLKAAGMKASPRPIETVGRVARAYTDREAG